jgi:hypothetical protein
MKLFLLLRRGWPNPSDAALKQGLEDAQFSGTVKNLFDDGLIQTIESNPKTRKYLQDADFMAKIDGLRNDPKSLKLIIHDERISEVVGFPNRSMSEVDILSSPFVKANSKAMNINISSGNKSDPHQQSLERELRELQLNDRRRSSPANDKCAHGWTGWRGKGALESRFIYKEFLDEAVRAADADLGDFVDKFAHGMQSSQKKHMLFWCVTSNLEHIKTHFISVGVDKLLDGCDGEKVVVCAYFVRFFEQYIDCLTEHKPMNASKTYELLFADHRAIVSFFRRRIRCGCLDEAYDTVRDLPKMAVCSNINCKLPNRRVEKSKLKSCSKCYQVHYCSKACQRIAWPEHKKMCGKLDEIIARKVHRFRQANPGAEDINIVPVQL